MQKIIAICAAFLAGAAAAQNYTTATEVKPILTATKPQWIAVRPYEGQDWLYFTNLLAWRCGVATISYGINGAPAETPLEFEPCYEDEAAPNAMKLDKGVFPYVTLPLSSIETVTLFVTYDDGTTDTADYARKAVLIP